MAFYYRKGLQNQKPAETSDPISMTWQDLQHDFEHVTLFLPTDLHFLPSRLGAGLFFLSPLTCF